MFWHRKKPGITVEEIDAALAAWSSEDFARTIITAALAVATGREITPPELAEMQPVVEIARLFQDGPQPPAVLDKGFENLAGNPHDPAVRSYVAGFQRLATDKLLDMRREAAAS